MNTFSDITHTLTDAGVVPSVQRIEILDYLRTYMHHPTAEQIFNALRKKGPRISKATVYNTLHLFAEKGLVRVLTAQGKENRFDIITHDHGHFICEKCGTIYNFDVNADRFAETASGFLKDCKINQKDFYIKGVCANCLQTKSQEGGTT